MMLLAHVIALTSLLASSASGDDPVVNTTHGLLRGLRMRVLERDLDVFRSVPFAAPPVGSLRFRKPEPLEPWEGIRNATEIAPSCPQVVSRSPSPLESMLSDVIQEDCLYLNVWAPRIDTSQGPKAIMVWIYGGSFLRGTISKPIYNGSFLAAHGDVIVVTVNYRLGALGFLFLGTPEVPGNMALWDQRLALEWVRDNAASFGGDPARITIFGQSAGAAAAHTHVISPQSRDLISGAILESGSALAPWSVLDPNLLKQRSLSLAGKAGCPTDSEEDAARCLRQADPMTLMTLERTLVADPAATILTPVVDGDFLPQSPEQLYREGKVGNISMLLGGNRDEMGLFLAAYLPLDPSLVISRSDFQQLAARLLQLTRPNASMAAAIPAVLSHYKAAAEPEHQDDYLSLLTQVGSDVLFHCSATHLAALQSSSGVGAHAWFYLFEHFLSTNAALPRWMGVKHGDEVALVFGMPLDPNLPFYTQDEKQLSRRFMSYWSQFAKTGNPNLAGLPHWPEYHHGNRKDAELYLSLDVVTSQRQGFRRQACAFLSDVIPLLLGSGCPGVSSGGR